MSILNGIIPPQGFEIVRDLIGAILSTELNSQKALQPIDDEEINVYVGRNDPFQQSERLMFNVLTDSGEYSNGHQRGVTGEYTFFIDIYVSAKENYESQGGFVATRKRDMWLGMVRYILASHQYNTLGLPLGRILNTTVKGFENLDSSDDQDAAFVKMSRLSFAVKMTESQSLWEGIEINSIFTNVKLDLTNKGYKYELIN